MSTIAASGDTDDRQKARDEQLRKFLEIVDIQELVHPFAEFLKRAPQPKPATRNGNPVQARTGQSEADQLRRLAALEARTGRYATELLQIHAELGKAQLQARISARIHRAVTEVMQAHTAPRRRVFSWQRDAPGHAPPHWW